MARHFVAHCLAFVYNKLHNYTPARQQHIGLHGTLIEPRK